MGLPHYFVLSFFLIASLAQADYGKLPLTFERNQGQADARVKFLAHGDRSTLFLTRDEVVLAFGSSQSVLRMKFAGANPDVTAEGLSEAPGKTNYLIGNDPLQWRHSV